MSTTEDNPSRENTVSLNIKDSETHRLAQALAKETGETMTRAIAGAETNLLRLAAGRAARFESVARSSRLMGRERG